MTPTHPTQASVGEVRHTPAEIIRAWCASCGYAAPSNGDCMALAAALIPAPTACKGMNCTASAANGFAHSPECLAEHSAAIDGSMTDATYPRDMDIIAIAYKWAKTAGFFDFERNDFISCVKEIADATCALRGAQKESGWRPITEAPVDGRTLLLGWFNSHGKWRTTRGMWLSQAYIDEYFEDQDLSSPGWVETSVEDDDGQCWPIKPSHFQFLPSPPTPEGEAK